MDSEPSCPIVPALSTRSAKAADQHKLGLIECVILAVAVALVAWFAVYTSHPQIESDLRRPYVPLGTTAR